MRRETPGLGASEFTSVGRFGIGFYSVFMLGDLVKVVSRRFDEASSSTRVLEFMEGVAVRPILRPATADEVRHVGGTSVSVRLRDDPQKEGGLLVTEDDIWFRLSELCAFLAPAIDCDLDSQFQSEPSQRCVSANDWLTVPGEELLRRIGEHYEYAQQAPLTDIDLADVADRLRPIVVNDQVIGRAALAPSPPDSLDGDMAIRTPGCVTIGGLLAGRDLGDIAGIVQGSPATADRLKFDLNIPSDVWAAWATSQAELWQELANSRISNRRRSRDAAISVNLLPRLGGQLGDIAVCRCSAGFLSLNQVMEWTKDLEYVLLLDSYSIDVLDSADGGQSMWETDSHREVELLDSVLVQVNSTQYGTYDHYGDPYPDKTYLSHAPGRYETLTPRGWYYRTQLTLSARILQAVVTSWSTTIDAIIDSLEVEYSDPLSQVVIGRDPDDQDVICPFPLWHLRRP